MPPKRPVDNVEADEAIQAVGIEDNDWLQKLLDVENEQLVLIISRLVNEKSIDNRSIKRARTELPSFSTAKRIDFAAKTNLPEDPNYLELTYFETPVYQLPPSFHQAIFENSWRAQDVYQEAVEQTRGESRVRILDPYIVPILALFQGRVIDKPEQAMLATTLTTGGEVEHEIIMLGGILFFVIEVKLDKPSSNNLAQLFLEFVSAAKVNKRAHFEGLRIYGVLTNLTRFAFYSYEPISNTFCEDEEFFVEMLRDGFSSGMIHVTNKIFGLVLTAFIDGLRASAEKSKQRAVSSVGSSTSVSSTSVPTKGKQMRQTTKGWHLALSAAEDCRQKLMEKVTTIEEMEIVSTEALDLLTKSVRSIPRYSAYTTKQRSSCLTPSELKDLAREIVESTLRASLSQP